MSRLDWTDGSVSPGWTWASMRPGWSMSPGWTRLLQGVQPAQSLHVLSLLFESSILKFLISVLCFLISPLCFLIFPLCFLIFPLCFLILHLLLLKTHLFYLIRVLGCKIRKNKAKFRHALKNPYIDESRWQLWRVLNAVVGTLQKQGFFRCQKWLFWFSTSFSDLHPVFSELDFVLFVCTHF